MTILDTDKKNTKICPYCGIRALHKNEEYCSVCEKFLLEQEKYLIIEGTELRNCTYGYHPTEIMVPPQITSLCRDALRKQRRLKKIIFPDSVLYIGSNALASTGLENITLPKNLRALGIAPFCYCPYLSKIEVAEGNQYFNSVDGVLFYNDRKELKQYPAGKKEVSYNIPEGTEVIAEKAFAGCKNLQYISIPHSMTIISQRAFSGCSGLKEILIPEWVKKVDKDAFSYCTSLSKVTIPRALYIEDAFTGCGDITIKTIGCEEHIQDTDTRTIRLKTTKKAYPDELNKIILSRNFLKIDTFTSERILDYSADCTEFRIGTKTYSQKITKEFAKTEYDYIDDAGIVKLGTYVKSGDVLICRASPQKGRLYSIYDEIILGRTDIDWKEDNIHVPDGVKGKVADIKVEYKRDGNGNAFPERIIDRVTVYVVQKFPIAIGDILSDNEENQGIVVAFSDLTDCDLIANFPLSAPLKKEESVFKKVIARSIGDYHPYHFYPIPKRESFGEITHVVSGIPQHLSQRDILKLNKSGFLDVLQNILLYQSDQPQNRNILYRNLIKGIPTETYDLPYMDINQFYHLCYALCIKQIFRDGNDNELNFSFIDGANQLNQHFGEKTSLELAVLSDDEIRKMSSGEVIKPEIYSYRTNRPEPDGLFCEKIFGPTQDYKCYCGKYSRPRDKGIICDCCGVEVTVSAVRYERMGHIELCEPISHPFLPQKLISAIPVMPPALRPHIRLISGKYATSDINSIYEKIINHNDRLKRLKELNAGSIIIQAARKRLSDAVSDLMLFHSNGSPFSVMNRMSSIFCDHMTDVALDFTAQCRAIIDDSLSDDQCGLPFDIAVTLFKTKLAGKLCALHITETFGIAKEAIEAEFDGKNGDRQGIITQQFYTLLQSQKILVFGSGSEGQALALTPVSTDLPVLTLNSKQYHSLRIELGEIVKIIFPVSDAAQAMMRETTNKRTKECGSLYEAEQNTDFVKDISRLAMDGFDITDRLVHAITDHEICTFDTIVSRYLFGKPSQKAWKIYKFSPGEIIVKNKKQESLPNLLFIDDTEYLFHRDDELKRIIHNGICSLYRGSRIGSKYHGNVILSNQKQLVIPNEVHQISDKCFCDEEHIQYAVFPDCLEKIGSFAFSHTGLKNLLLPMSILEIGTGAFSFCYNLNKIEISTENKFFQTENDVLFSVDKKQLILYPAGKRTSRYVIPQEVETISPMAFAGCKYLEEIILPFGMREIPANAFYGCFSLKSICIPSSIKEIGSNAFSYCVSLQEVIIPQDVTIANNAFTKCIAFKNEIPLTQMKMSEKNRIPEKEIAEQSLPDLINEAEGNSEFFDFDDYIGTIFDGLDEFNDDENSSDLFGSTDEVDEDISLDSLFGDDGKNDH